VSPSEWLTTWSCKFDTARFPDVYRELAAGAMELSDADFDVLGAWKDKRRASAGGPSGHSVQAAAEVRLSATSRPSSFALILDRPTAAPRDQEDTHHRERQGRDLTWLRHRDRGPGDLPGPHHHW
jgi:hypothetical protein